MTLRLVLLTVLLAISTSRSRAHDIPNARVDRGIQIELHPGSIRIDYEVSLAELTLTQDLRSLIGSLPQGGRDDWFKRYAEETAELNGRGLLLSVDDKAIELTLRDFDWRVEDHPRFFFHYEASLPSSGALRLIDSNYAASEGTSRLAMRVVGELETSGDSPPTDLALIPVRPAWLLTPEEERRGTRIDFRYGPGRAMPSLVARAPRSATPPHHTEDGRLSRLLETTDRGGWPILALMAFALGVVHSIQPGHGKMLVAVGSLAGGSRWRGVGLGMMATLSHLVSITAIATILWITGATDFPALNRAILHLTGFLLAAIGIYRIGAALGIPPDYRENLPCRPKPKSNVGFLAIAFGAGAMPCWDAVGLLILATALHRLALGIALVISFSLGMATVLVIVGWFASRVVNRTAGRDGWARPMGLVGSIVLALIGGTFLFA